MNLNDRLYMVILLVAALGGFLGCETVNDSLNAFSDVYGSTVRSFQDNSSSKTTPRQTQSIPKVALTPPAPKPVSVSPPHKPFDASSAQVPKVVTTTARMTSLPETSSIPQNSNVAIQTDMNAQQELDSMWRDYQQFNYQNATLHLYKVLYHSESSPKNRAVALIIAAASYYVIDMKEIARNCLRDAVKEDASAIPNAEVFPSELIIMHEELLKNEQ